MSSRVHELRIAVANDQPVRPERAFVLYWMRAARRLSWNHALDRAIEHARDLDRPLVVFEAIRAGYEHASDRFHRFCVEGMAENADEARRAGVVHYPYVEPEPGAGRGLLRALADHACVVVTDDAPAFHFPAMLASAAGQVDVRLEAVDANGILPLRLAERAFPTAYAFRRHAQRALPEWLDRRPVAASLGARRLGPAARLPADVPKRWAPVSGADLAAPDALITTLPIDHDVAPVPIAGGSRTGRARLAAFVRGALGGYAEHRNHPDEDGESGLSAWLHWGHVGAHEVVAAVLARAGEPRMVEPADGRRAGWWGLDESAESFLDQIVTWRELSLNLCQHVPDYADYATLPEWARATLAKHAGDRRPHLYELDVLERAATRDRVWNAAQRQLLETGRIHNYLRMLWGKKVLEWSPSPEEAYHRLLHLNDRFAIDGRDPNGYASVGWILGRFDRAWGPERPIFGTIRYMSTENTKRKLHLKSWLAKYEGAPVPS